MRNIRLQIVLSGTVALVLVGGHVSYLRSSGYFGIYAIVDRIVFEPDTDRPERVQVWGAFALTDRGFKPESDGTHMEPTRGYLYLSLPESERDAETARTEWADLASLAGTGQAVAFGQWFYGGRITRSGVPEWTDANYEQRPPPPTNLRIRAAEEAVRDPDEYRLHAGIAMVSPASHPELVTRLREIAQPPLPEPRAMTGSGVSRYVVMLVIPILLFGAWHVRVARTRRQKQA